MPPFASESDVFNAARAQAFTQARRRVDYDTAEDIASEVAISVWKRTQSHCGFPANQDELGRFVSTAVRHELLDHVRDSQRRSEREAVFQTASQTRDHLWMSPEGKFSYSELDRAANRVLSRTPLGRRLAYMLVHEEQMTCASAAEMLGISTDAVEKRVQRTRAKLQKELAPYRDRGARTCAVPAGKRAA